MEALIWTLLFINAPQYGIDPKLAGAVISTESQFKPKAIGRLGEVGLFQIRPEYSRFTPKELLNININVIAGLEMLKEAKDKCKFAGHKAFVVCFNSGITGGRRLKYPTKAPYYRKVISTYLRYLK